MRTCLPVLKVEEEVAWRAEKKYVQFKHQRESFWELAGHSIRNAFVAVCTCPADTDGCSCRTCIARHPLTACELRKRGLIDGKPQPCPVQHDIQMIIASLIKGPWRLAKACRDTLSACTCAQDKAKGFSWIAAGAWKRMRKVVAKRSRREKKGLTGFVPMRE